MGTSAPLLCHPLCLSCLCPPVMVAWFALIPCNGPIVVTHILASSSAFKEARGEPVVKACHSASSELAINTLACPQGPKQAARGVSAGGRYSQCQCGAAASQQLQLVALSRAVLSQNSGERLQELPPTQPRPWDACGALGQGGESVTDWGQCPGQLCRLLTPQQRGLGAK